jgi:glycosyltransferase involved in cell wall biosynthesis
VNGQGLLASLAGKRAGRYAYALFGMVAYFFELARTKGLRPAVARTVRLLAAQPREAWKKISTKPVSNQERYLREQHEQSAYLQRYVARFLDIGRAEIFKTKLLDELPPKANILIYPLSYPRELIQRPDHVLRYFASRSFVCIVLTIEDGPPYVEKRPDGVYVTNLFAAVYAYVSRRNVTLYITYPFYAYLAELLPQAFVIYDVLDDLSLFSLYSQAMESDHEKLLASSHVSLFSSDVLYTKNKDRIGKREFLILNGVWRSDFETGFPRPAHVVDLGSSGSRVLGYHGAISDLLDWELLRDLTAIPGIRLVLIGPVTRFLGDSGSELRVRVGRVLAHPSVTHIPTVPYGDLKHYIGQFDAAIIPFAVSDKTDAVEPLKLYEYMAMHRRIFATPTASLRRHDHLITVAAREALCALIRNWAEAPQAGVVPDYGGVLSAVDWGKQLRPVADLRLQPKAPRTKPGYKRADIVNLTFYDLDGAVCYNGGAERYVRDLALLLQEKDYDVRLIQGANCGFRKTFEGIPVIGVSTENGINNRNLSTAYRDVCADTDLIIASPVDLACELWTSPTVIGINHGVHWDHKHRRLTDSIETDRQNVFDGLRASALCVSVDTNFINWVRAHDYRLTRRLRYVPNYADTAVFRPREKSFDDVIVALYPRRLYEARGIFITISAFDTLLPKHPNLRLHLAGQANAEDARLVNEFIERHRTQVSWQIYEMGEMSKAYESSHVVLIPTLYSEGTSLSCIEAMTTNNAIIATTVGGLPNLVVDGFNGFLIHPSDTMIVAAMEKMLGDRESLKLMAANGLAMANAFSKTLWNDKWHAILGEACEA